MSYIFLDESGDLGFEKEKNSSKYFVIAILFTSDKKSIEKAVKKTHSALRKNVKKLSGGILHSYKEKPSTRKKLLKLISNKENIKIMCIYLNKSKVHTKLQNEKQVLYNYVTNILLDRIMTKKLIDKKSPITLVAAKRETNRFLNENFRIYLKKQTLSNHELNINVEIKTTSEEKSLQAVDFISWAIYRKYEKSDDSYYKIIKNKIFEENSLFK